MKLGIITIVDNNNYGNRLQNYALSQYIRKNFNTYEVVTLKNIKELNNDNDSKLKNYFKRIKYIFIKKIFLMCNKRYNNFKQFNKYINFSKETYDKYHLPADEEYDFIIIGSDQVWNYNFAIPDLYFGKFKKNNVISYSASFGVSDIPKYLCKSYRQKLKNISNISVREEIGKKIINELLGKNDIEVLIDPTMLLTREDWEYVIKKPEMLNNKKFILNYFLGNLSEVRRIEIERVAIKNNCEIINILDIKSPFYQCGPSEFLYLIKNAFLICTDSFHSCVFSLLFDKSFVVFEREDEFSESINKMNSRINNLISKFELQDRIFNGKITDENLNHNYKHSYKILEEEREKSKEFLKKVI